MISILKASLALQESTSALRQVEEIQIESFNAVQCSSMFADGQSVSRPSVVTNDLTDGAQDNYEKHFLSVKMFSILWQIEYPRFN